MRLHAPYRPCLYSALQLQGSASLQLSYLSQLTQLSLLSDRRLAEVRSQDVYPTSLVQLITKDVSFASPLLPLQRLQSLGLLEATMGADQLHLLGKSLTRRTWVKVQ